MISQDQIDELKPPFLQKLFSMCSNYSEQDFQKHPPKLQKWNSYFDNEQVPEKLQNVQGETNNIHDESPIVEGNLQFKQFLIKQYCKGMIQTFIF